jgi:hypothetical protein
MNILLENYIFNRFFFLIKIKREEKNIGKVQVLKKKKIILTTLYLYTIFNKQQNSSITHKVKDNM